MCSSYVINSSQHLSFFLKQRKKASERKELEPDFEEKRLNLSVDEERELNKENERMPKIIPKDPYYDQQA